MTTSWQILTDTEESKDPPKTNLLIIDGNNLAFRYIRRANYNSFSEDYIKTIQSLGKSYGALKTIVCFDYGRSKYRLAMYPEYKANRKKPTDPEELKQKEEFFECLNKTIPLIPCDTHKIYGVEADDLITYFTLKYKDSFDHVWIVSSDKDLYQVLDENVSIFNIFSRKEITPEYLAENFNGLTPFEFRLSRYIEGEPGDNIIGVEGIGPKRAQTLAKEYKSLDKLLKALPIKSKAQYIKNLNESTNIILRNEKLINFFDYHTEALKVTEEGMKFLENESQS